MPPYDLGPLGPLGLTDKKTELAWTVRCGFTMGQLESVAIDNTDDDETTVLNGDRTIHGIAAAIREGRVKKICVLIGAGISCNAGIPDFRSPVTGIYNNLQEYNLPTPEAMFELEFFRKNPSVFYRFLHVGLDPLHSRHRHFFPERTNRRIRTTSSSCWRRKVCYCVYIRRTSTDWSVSRD